MYLFFFGMVNPINSLFSIFIFRSCILPVSYVMMHLRLLISIPWPGRHFRDYMFLANVFYYFLTEHQAMNAYWGSGGIDPLIL